jgi:hypothetical protein
MTEVCQEYIGKKIILSEECFKNEAKTDYFLLSIMMVEHAAGSLRTLQNLLQQQMMAKMSSVL